MHIKRFPKHQLNNNVKKSIYKQIIYTYNIYGDSFIFLAPTQLNQHQKCLELEAFISIYTNNSSVV
jgi:hypothetical protein